MANSNLNKALEIAFELRAPTSYMHAWNYHDLLHTAVTLEQNQAFSTTLHFSCICTENNVRLCWLCYVNILSK